MNTDEQTLIDLIDVKTRLVHLLTDAGDREQRLFIAYAAKNNALAKAWEYLSPEQCTEVSKEHNRVIEQLARP